VTAAAVGAYDAGREELAALMADQPGYRVDQVWRGLYTKGLRPEEMTDLPRGLRARLDDALPSGLQLAAESKSQGSRTVKWLWRLSDGSRVETVLMRYPRRATVCVSSQAGCAMGCSFCATGQAGFDRHLTVGEIVEQVVVARRAAEPDHLSNVVFMGMGEPLANYDRVWEALRRIHDDIGLSARHLTISTVGVVPGIRRLAHEDLPVNLAVSLHAANDALRSRLVPLNKRYPLSALMEACRQYQVAKGRRLSFEWALIAGVNDRPADARELSDLARPLGAHINLIPLNPTPGYSVRGTSPEGVRAFRDSLGRMGVNATVRQNRGTDIDAACGQLAARSIAMGVTGVATSAAGGSAPVPPPARRRSAPN
jgi:23S rRNA (adenine2503-C2)-methyltransferase